MNTGNFVNKFIISPSLLIFGLGGCDASVDRWRIDGGILACKDHGGVIRLITWINEVECVDGKIVYMKRAE